VGGHQYPPGSPLNSNSETLNEIVLDMCFRELNPQHRVTLLQYYLSKNLDVHVDDVTLEASLFLEISRKNVSMISGILGKYDDQVVDEFVLGCMVSICLLMMKPLTKFNHVQFLSNQIHHQPS
jgi:hypothetical protein